MTLWSEQVNLQTILSEQLHDLAVQEGWLPAEELEINTVEERYRRMLDDAAEKLTKLQRPRSERAEYDKPELILRSAIASAELALAAYRRFDVLLHGGLSPDDDGEDDE